jgi:hypothetical protein
MSKLENSYNLDFFLKKKNIIVGLNKRTQSLNFFYWKFTLVFGVFFFFFFPSIASAESEWKKPHPTWHFCLHILISENKNFIN